KIDGSALASGKQPVFGDASMRAPVAARIEVFEREGVDAELKVAGRGLGEFARPPPCFVVDNTDHLPPIGAGDEVDAVDAAVERVRPVMKIDDALDLDDVGARVVQAIEHEAQLRERLIELRAIRFLVARPETEESLAAQREQTVAVRR